MWEAVSVHLQLARIPTALKGLKGQLHPTSQDSNSLPLKRQLHAEALSADTKYEQREHDSRPTPTGHSISRFIVSFMLFYLGSSFLEVPNPHSHCEDAAAGGAAGYLSKLDSMDGWNSCPKA